MESWDFQTIEKKIIKLISKKINYINKKLTIQQTFKTKGHKLHTFEL